MVLVINTDATQRRATPIKGWFFLIKREMIDKSIKPKYNFIDRTALVTETGVSKEKIKELIDNAVPLDRVEKEIKEKGIIVEKVQVADGTITTTNISNQISLQLKIP